MQMSNTSMLQQPKQLRGSYCDGVAILSRGSGLMGNQAAPSHWTSPPKPPTPAPGAPLQLRKKKIPVN